MARPLASQHPVGGDASAVADDDRIPLRLTVARGKLGIELYEPVDLGPLSLTGLGLSLPDLSFPVDLSGGVRTFRHRRGDLERVELGASRNRLGRWLRGRWRHVLGGLVRPPLLWPVPGGIGVGAFGPDGAVAFDLLWAPVDAEARFIVASARGAGLGAPALAVALQLVDTGLSGAGTRQGRVVAFSDVGDAVGRAVLPAVGARAPRARGLRFGTLEVAGDELRVTLDATAQPPRVPAVALRALELARTTREADDALAAGDVDAARAAYVEALERAPRQPEIVRTVVDIDAIVAGRAEAALSLLSETLEPGEYGPTGAELLARAGEPEAARHALSVATADEPFAPVAALWWLRLSELSPDARAGLSALDQAVARAPALPAPRWARLTSRLGTGDVEGALADAEHLEAAARGSRAKHEACRRAASELLRAGFVREAGRAFERALRYVPDDAEATAGLGRSLLEVGKVERAVALLERAVELDAGHSAALLSLGRVLAERMGDLPNGVARVREIPATAPEGLEARFLEASWRARLGDRRGATLAFARMRQAIDAEGAIDARRAAEWLLEAARFEDLTVGDPLAAERHLAHALRLRPRDERLAAAYREVAEKAAAVEASR